MDDLKARQPETGTGRGIDGRKHLHLAGTVLILSERGGEPCAGTTSISVLDRAAGVCLFQLA